MSTKDKIFVANWKMQKTVHQSIQFIQDNLQDLKSLKKTIIICPSFTDLYPLAPLMQQTPVFLGAQDCSEFMLGAYTGQISAQTLAQIGCQYCIIGHSESRLYFKQTDEQIARKCVNLLSVNITPIVCIGESQKDFTQKKSLDVLESQLNPLLALLARETYSELKRVYIAYEPLWAIGSTSIPTSDYLTMIFEKIDHWCSRANANIQYTYLYGGGVDVTTLPLLCDVKRIEGFLVGGASLDFQKFKNLVSYR